MDDLDDAWTSGAKTIGNLHGATNHGLGSSDGKCVAGLRKQVVDPTQNDLVNGKKMTAA